MTDGTIPDRRIVDVEFIHDLFQPFGAVSVRRMFGGAGLFADGVMFGLVSGCGATSPCRKPAYRR